MLAEHCRVVSTIALGLALLGPLGTHAQDSKPEAQGAKNLAHELEAVSNDRSPRPGEGRRNVAVLLYENVLLLDYGIAAEMFLGADYMRAFHVYTVGRTENISVSILGATKVDHSLADAPQADIVIIPGGPLWQQEGANPETIAYLKNQQEGGAILYSICTGGMLLAKAGFLDDRNVTTLHAAEPMLKTIAPSAHFRKATYVDDGNLFTAAGAGSAIEATLYLIEKLTTKEIAADMRDRYLDYPHPRSSALD